MARFLDFKVTLNGVRTPPWRRFLLKGSLSFQQLHRAIQDACGWEDAHLFGFEDLEGRALAVSPLQEPEPGYGQGVPVAGRVKLARHFKAAGDAAVYQYDFGDDWWHRVELLGTQDLPVTASRFLLGGGGSFPPEDCGGLEGYRDCLRAARNPAKADPELLLWLDGWHPEGFDLAAVQASFDAGRRLPPRWAAR